jgi:hypothetical protein
MSDITHYTQRPDVQKFYTTQEVADLLDTSTDKIRNIVSYYHIAHEIVQTKISRAMLLNYDAVRLVKAYYEKRQKAFVKIPKAAEKPEEETEGAENHPLVTNKRWLKLNEWPDTIPECFKECEE